MSEHTHEWHKTGERYPMLDPVYIYHCGCDATGIARADDPVGQIRQVDADYRKWCIVCARAEGLRGGVLR